MINISDIQKRLLENPEPKEVSDLRTHITSAFKNLEFVEGPHKYYLHNPDGTTIELPSVSSVIHQFEPPQDWDLIREKTAKRNGVDPEVLRRQWRETNILSTSNGTKTHFFLENLLNLWVYGESGLSQFIKDTQYEEGFIIPYGNKEKAGSDFFQMVLGTPNVYPVMPETKIYTGLTPEYSFKQEYCGTFDLLMAEKDTSGKITPFLMDWKGLPLDTPILTSNGFKKMGDLKIDDLVYDKEGKQCKILHISEIHENPCYRIDFLDGTSIVADQDHRWEILMGSPVVMTTLDIEKALQEFPGVGLKVDIVKPWDGPNIKLKKEPKEIGKTCDGNIPDEIMGASLEQRLKVLYGLMESYGKYNPSRDNYSVITNNCDKVIGLLESFGISSLMREDDGKEVFYRPHFCPFENGEYPVYPKADSRKIIKVTKVPTVKTKCIEVDSETHTYLAGYELIVTHNTNKSLTNDYSRKNGKMLLPPFQDMFDEPLSLYTLQLNCYQMGIQQLGYNVGYRMIIWLKDDGTYEIIQVPDVTDRLKLIL